MTPTPILHVDLDAFFASVLLRERPELREVPVAVGGGHRSVVLAANYPARAFGVRSAMTGAQARRLCPHVVFLPPDSEGTATVSRSVMELFRRVTPCVEVVSPDEAFLDVRGAARTHGPPAVIAETLRARVHDEHGLTCSVGVAATISVAKLASRRAKPDGVLVVPPEAVVAVVHPLDVGELYGVGPKTRARLHRLGLATVGEVAATPVADLRRALGNHLGAHLHQLAWGTDRSEVSPGAVGVFGHGPRSGEGAPERSVGNQETFGRDTGDRAVVVRELLRLSARVATRLRAAGLVGRTVTITVRFSDFTTITRGRTLREHTDVTRDVHEAATVLYDALGLRRVLVRLVGVRVSNLLPRDGLHRQGVLGEREHSWSAADQAVDRAAHRFGTGVVRPASLLR